MKIEITEEVTREVEVTFPLFTKSITSHFMFKSKDECVCVGFHSDDGVVVEKHVKNRFPTSWMLKEECSSDEFYDALKRAMSELNKLI